MVVMAKELLAEVSIFLRETLAEEKLSQHAQSCRQQLISKLNTRQISPPPQAYIDMNGGPLSQGHDRVKQQNSGFYEEFDSCVEAKQKGNQQNQWDRCENNNLYKNQPSTYEENVYDNDNETYINLKESKPLQDNEYSWPSSPLANMPVPQKLPLTNNNSSSTSNSERNSIISLIKKDTTDRSSDSSSFTSNSTRCADESAEISGMSASALRYAASKYGILRRREKAFMFIDHTKSYWVALLNQTLYIFTSDKDSKPVLQLDITGYQARPVASQDRPDCKFELVAPGRKTYQFLAEKQSEMDKWISEVNAAARVVESGPKEWARGLPPPPDLDVPDSPEYELPDPLERAKNSPSPQQSLTALSQALEVYLSKDRRPSNQSMPRDRYVTRASDISKPRVLPSVPPEETYDHPEPGKRVVAELHGDDMYHSIENTKPLPKPMDTLRRLPSLPHEQEFEYDRPETSVPRPVKPPELIQEEFYAVIDNNIEPTTQESVYKNTENEIKEVQESLYINSEADNNGNEEDSNYYNLVPCREKETEQECIYDVISEQRYVQNPSPHTLKSTSPDVISEQRYVQNSSPPTLKTTSTDVISEQRYVQNLSPQTTSTGVISEQRYVQNPSLTTLKTTPPDKKVPLFAAKPVASTLNREFLEKLERSSFPLACNTATIFSKPAVKPNLKMVKPPILNKSYQ